MRLQTDRTDQPEIDLDLDRFTSDDDAAARGAFERLYGRLERALSRYIARKVDRQEDREDVLCDACGRILTNRRSFENRGVGAWTVFVFRIAHRCVVDHYRRHSEEPIEDLEGQLDPEDAQAIEDVAEAALRRQLYRAADECWLGIDAGRTDRDHHRRLLAAQLFYVDRMEFERVRGALAVGSDPETLDEWLLDPSTVRALFFTELYLSPDGLCALLLKVDEEALGRIEREPDVYEGPWSHAEAAAIIARYRRSFLVDQIPGRVSNSPAKPELLALFDRCLAQFPFVVKMRHMLTGPMSLTGLIGVAAEDGVWKRLVFEYFAAHELPQRDIFERVSPPAAEGGFALSPETITAWLSANRLAKQLAGHVGRRIEAVV